MTPIERFAAYIVGRPLYPSQAEVANAILHAINNGPGWIIAVMMARPSGKKHSHDRSHSSPCLRFRSVSLRWVPDGHQANREGNLRKRAREKSGMPPMAKRCLGPIVRRCFLHAKGNSVLVLSEPKRFLHLLLQ